MAATVVSLYLVWMSILVEMARIGEMISHLRHYQ